MVVYRGPASDGLVAVDVGACGTDGATRHHASAISSFATGRGLSIWQEVTEALDNGHHLTISSNGLEVTASVNELALSYYGGIGDEDSAFSISFTSMGVALAEDVAFVLKGNNIVTVGLSGTGSATAGGMTATLYTLSLIHI